MTQSTAMSAPPKIRLDRTRLAAPQVLEKLREAILSLELAPGTVLVRQELADRFGVSQTPVREALLRLSEEALVDVFPQHAKHISCAAPSNWNWCTSWHSRSQPGWSRS
jgi:DNA-binding GntR family transcriptional regulator